MEFGLNSNATTSNYGGYGANSMNPPPSGGGMEWYTPSPAYNYNTGAAPSAAHGYGAGGTMGGGGHGSFEDEPPLLEELGIDLGGIFKKTRSVLFHRLDNRVLDDLDMGGALVFVFLLGGLHLLMGKIHFGVILGWSVVHSAVLWFVVNQMAGADAAEAKALELYSICCIAGYAMVPLVVYSAASLLIPRGLLSLALAALCTLWSGHTAAKIIVRRTPTLEGMQGLIMYPCLLVYAAFAMLCVY